MAANEIISPGDLSRRRFLQVGGAGALLLSTAGLLSGCGGSSPKPATSNGPTGKPKHGGKLRIAATGGSSADTIDVQSPFTSTDICRVWQLADPLARQNPTTGQPELFLAESLTSNSNFTLWTCRIKQGIMLHSGRELTSDDVLASFQRIYDKKTPKQGASIFTALDMANMKAVDKYTVTMPMHVPFNDVLATLASYYFMMVGRGYDPKKNPDTTGPFKFQSFIPGNSSTFVRNANYWQHGLPYVDSIQTINYTDEASQVNALSTGQVELIDLLSAQSVAAVRGTGANLVVSQSGAWNSIFLRTDLKPFNDVRARQAFRLIANRPQLNKLVNGGYGELGNDVWSPDDPLYDKSLPHRVQDLAQAKSLLKSAGHDGLTLNFPAADVAQGTVSMAQVFAQQASGAGVTLKIQKKTVTDYFATSYGQSPIGVSFWYNQPYLATAALNAVGSAPFNETKFHNTAYDGLFAQAMSTKNASLKTELAHKMQKIDYDTGGEIIPFFNPSIDASAKNVGGLVKARNGLPLSGFDFTRFWIQ